MHGPASVASKRSRSAYPSPVVRDTSRCTGHERRLDRIALAAEHKRVDRHLELQPAALAGAEAQPPEIERVSSEGHRH